ncbi:30S ribosomal protein S13 [Spizellomyces punctatus DAOM BR117]|uniref:30S ribosomal protein S13 n=1 Tax=Spizellomyces punctatus (strain DAOM BR117) TaxID=645134 RepID=A0A0L0H6M4_SPIPD|nr:30S ribosomal protein S13 [Spizellomyces punctatus DAOM BR117]KNC96383.1 30S ribosomal protein S13 [Spizellomyces punctatus DAOM BR117]|eukprot:XP_016604423.1 30S ribosomal protein S13 [Spizellomyces punctatus DAOM BR117]
MPDVNHRSAAPQTMLYLLGVNLPDDKVVSIALTRIYGVGLKTGQTICHKLGIHPRCRLKDLPEDKVTKLSALLNTMQIDAELKRETRNRIGAMVQMGSYRGARHKAGLPVNGQRTHTNRSTAKRLNGRWLRMREFSSASRVTSGPSPSTLSRMVTNTFAPVGRVLSRLL